MKAKIVFSQFQSVVEKPRISVDKAGMNMPIKENNLEKYDSQSGTAGCVTQETPRILSQLQPFNEARFDAAIAWLAWKHDRSLSKYEIVKLHVLMDVFHVIEFGSPIIGGRLAPWELGPVMDEAYGRVDDWCDQFDYGGASPANFKISAKGTLRYLTPTITPEPGDFSASELAAMERAWELLMPMMNKGYNGYLESKEFFHSDTTFIGRAYNKAKLEDRAIDWNEIIDAYDAINHTDHTSVKIIIGL